MASVEIRKALETDLENIQLCTRKAYALYGDRMDREPAPMQADFRGRIASGFVDVATADSRFAGYVVFYPDGGDVHLENVAVLPEFSGQGIGRRLIEHVEHSARKVGYKTVELYTNEVMTENLAMYPGLGYTEVGRRREAGFSRVFFRKSVQA